MELNETIVKELIPSENMHLMRISDGSVFEGKIYLAKSENKADYTEISEQEYQQVLESQREIKETEIESEE